MTPLAHRLYEFIKGRLTTTGICPSYREMADALGLCSKGHVARIVRQLIRDGHLIRSEHKAQRALHLPVPGLRDMPSWMLTAELERRGHIFTQGAKA